MLKKGQKHHQPQPNMQLLPLIQPTNINQTIIINSPKFSIHYINQPKKKVKKNIETIDRQHRNSRKGLVHNIYKKVKDQKKSTIGFDNWILNKNLKQFGQTRNHGFLFDNQSKASPYITHRFRKANSTLRHESILKHREMNNMYDDINLVNKTIDSKLKETQKLMKAKSDQQTTAIQFRKRKFQLNEKARNIILELQNNKNSNSYKRDKKMQQLHNKDNLDESNNNNTYRSQKKNFRTNKFINHPRVITINKKDTIQTNNKLQQLKTNKNQQQQHAQNNTFRDQKNSQEQQYLMNQSQQLKDKKTMDKSITQIDKSIRKTFDAYFTQNVNQRSKSRNDIQIYLSSVRQPSVKQKNQFVSCVKQKNLDIYQCQFKFDEQKTKKRPKTPLRNFKLDRKQVSRSRLNDAIDASEEKKS